MIDDDSYDIGVVSCAFCDVARVLALGAAIVAVVAIAAIVVINRLRLW